MTRVQADASRPRARRKVRDGAGTRRRILQVATPMFADRGYSAVTTRQIARSARVTMPSIYRYFGDKRSLYLAACSDVLHTFGSMYSTELRAPGPPDRKILTFVMHLYDHWLTDACFAKIVMREIIERDEKGLDQLTRNHFTDHFEALTDICRRLGGTGGAQQRAFSIYATGFGYLQLSSVGRSAGIGGLRWRDPQAMARVVLTQVLPTINWGRVRPLSGPSNPAVD